MIIEGLNIISVRKKAYSAQVKTMHQGELKSPRTLVQSVTAYNSVRT